MWRGTASVPTQRRNWWYFGRLAGEQQAMERAGDAAGAVIAPRSTSAKVADIEQRLKNLVNQEGNEISRRSAMRWVCLWVSCRYAYRTPNRCRKTIDKPLVRTFQARTYSDTSSVFNTDPLHTIELVMV